MDEKYLELFFDEAQEYVNKINRCLVVLEKNPHRLESLNEMFRLMHTLKGMAASVGFDNLSKFAHSLEDVFDNLRARRLKFTPEIMDTIFQCIDAFEIMLEELQSKRKVSLDISSYLNKLKMILPLGEKMEDEEGEIKSEKVEFEGEDIAILQKREKDGKEIFKLVVYLKKECPMKGARAFLIVNQLRSIGEVIKSFPPVEKMKEQQLNSFFVVVLVTDKKREVVEKELLKISEIEKVTVEKLSFLQKVKSGEKKIQSMRIPVERLDKIMNFIGELSIAKSRLIQVVQSRDYTSFEEVAFVIEHLVNALQDEALKLRLFPISYILDTFPRYVRDLARRVNKEVSLKIKGGEIELDRVILDEVSDPLLHLVRNAVDHGIEPPEVRKKLGKSSCGEIKIEVTREKGHIIIEVSDDGKGIDFEEVVNRAQQKGLLVSKENKEVIEDQILEVLCQPGFSTCGEVSDISGRGVGLDVVKAKLDSLGGRLDFTTEKGRGTTFFLELPLTLAVINAMLVMIDEQIFAIPIMNIRETVKIKKEEVKFIKDFEVINLRGEIIPLIKLDEVLEIGSGKMEKEEISVVVVESRTKDMGLVVDRVIGEQDVVVKPLGKLLGRVKNFTGATILGDGRVALILDVINLIRQ
ncbi:MAG: hypothetical protein B6D56_03135 [Candidatus Omnitrophica bacterium 4484_70.1]|nr:MAG: hypothetical protein B6D56_03135 [Candidatus Omnitrophica bacterium 4484_70.1]